ncbi:MAG: Maf family nucleotide pyrophosphatase [Dehalogenimonas sp.]
MNNPDSELITIDLTTTGECGSALGWAPSGLPVNTFGGIAGETVQVHVFRDSEAHLEAVVEKVVASSPYRREPPCPYFGECSGCQWQHIEYSHQLILKQELVQNAITSQGIDFSINPVVPSPEEFGYRNHARFTVRRRLNQFGFINRVTRRFVPVSQCLIMTEGINSLMSALEGRCGETSQFSIRYGVNTDEYLIQPKFTNPEVTVITGQPYYHEIMAGRRFRVSSPAFFQVNLAQAEKLAEIIRDRLQLTGQETIIDAYAGVGTFAVLLAPHVKKAIAIEESGAAIKDARANIRDLDNVELLEARTESVLPHLGRLADAVIVDPSRNGCHPGALKTLNYYPSKRLIYVSCNPESLARDLVTLTHGPFDIEDITPVDLFPQTYHVETVATLKHNPLKETAFTSRQKLILASSSPRRAEILTTMGLQFGLAASLVAENPTPDLSPDVQALTHARSKATAVANISESGTIIAADTIVVLDGEILGKPSSPEQAAEMLKQLRGKTHQVITAVAVTDAATGETVADTRSSRVTMRHYTDDEITFYVNSGSPLDKAGAYGIQDKQFHPVAHIKGCYHNVVGLPVCLMMELLLKLGVHPYVSSNWPPDDGCRDCTKCQNA